MSIRSDVEDNISSPKMRWPIESENLRIDALDYIYQTRAINEFLREEGKFYVCGLKGLGKTLILKAKKKKFLEAPETKIKSYVIIPEYDLDVLTSFNPIEEYWTILKDTLLWRDIWGLSFGLSIISHFVGLNNEIGRKLEIIPAFKMEKHDKHKSYISSLIGWAAKGTKSNPSSFLTYIINSMNYNIYNSNIISDLYNGVSGVLVEEIRSGCAIFVDQVDKSWESLMTRYYQKREETFRLQQLQEIWYACQIGLVHAVNDICTKNHHVWIYTAVRQEVLGELEKDPNYLRYKDKMLIISYKKNDLKNVFIKSIRKFEPSENLKMPEKIRTNEIEAFLGIEKVKPFRIRTAEKEDVFDYMYRHTIQRPRDIIHIGKGISDIDPNDRNEDELKKLINLRSKENLIFDYIEDLKRLMDINFDIAYSLIDKNVLNLDEITNICRNYNQITGSEELCNTSCETCNKTHLFCSLYNIGLIGTIKDDLYNEGKKIQKFLEPEKRTLIVTKSILPRSEAYLLHPSLREEIEERRARVGKKFFRDPNLIVGDLREYPVNKDSVKPPSADSDRKKIKKDDNGTIYT